MALSLDRPLKQQLKKYLPHLLQAQAEGLNEADTVQRLIRVFEFVFGYDLMTDIGREVGVKDKFVDVALKVDGKVRILVEVKSAGTTLRDRHIDQAQAYGAHANIPWVLLTNGVVWKLFHLSFGEGIEAAPAFSVDLTDGVTDKGAQLLGLLHRRAVRKGDLDAYWVHRVALSPAPLAKALFAEEVLLLIRRELRRKESAAPDIEDLAEALQELFSVEARERIGPVKIRRRSARPTKKVEMSTTAGAEPIPEIVGDDAPRFQMHVPDGE